MMKSFCSRTVFLATAALAWILGTASATTAGVLYGVTGAGSTASSLYTIDTTTGAATLVGATGFSHVTGLAFNPVSGTLYGHVSALFDGGATQLITIDPATGAGTVVGTSGIQSPDMSFNSSGTLYAWGECAAAGPCDNVDDLYTIDLGTGAATLVGESGLDTAGTGLAFDSGGTLYLKSREEIRTLDPATGLPTSANSTLSEFLDNALAFDENDVPFSVDRGAGTSFLYTIDLNTSVATQIGDIGVSGISALAFQPQAIAEPGTLAIVGLGLAGLGLARRRRTA